LIVSDTKSQIVNLTKALNEYKLIYESAQKYKPKSLTVEIELCKQMLELLPEKINFLQKSSQTL
jgi:hypothetical protein